MSQETENTVPANSKEVRDQLVEALHLDLVGPWADHTLVEEKLPGWIRPSKWYLTGFMIPVGTPPEQAADSDEEEDEGVVPDSAGLSEESSQENKAAKKGFFPSSMGLSFLVPKEESVLTVTVRWGDYTQEKIEGDDGKQLSVWQRHPHESTVVVPLKGSGDLVVHDVPDSDGLQLQLVERLISAEDLK